MLIFPPPSTLQTLFIEIYEMLNTIFEVKDSCFFKYNASKNEKKKNPGYFSVYRAYRSLCPQ